MKGIELGPIANVALTKTNHDSDLESNLITDMYQSSPSQNMFLKK